VNSNTSPVLMMIFSELGALSHRGQLSSFDKDADGTLLGEGVGMVVLKRLAEAERDGNHIYAVLKNIGIASDGRATHVLAPRVEGEEMALRRAYEPVEIDPLTVGLLEAHGTGTPVGDVVEVQALRRVFPLRPDRIAALRARLGEIHDQPYRTSLLQELPSRTMRLTSDRFGIFESNVTKVKPAA
jgi:acyl transferase domain-containing protein